MTRSASGVLAPGRSVALQVADGATAPVAPSHRRRSSPAQLGEALLVGAASLLCAAWVLRLWSAHLAVPLRYASADDAKFYLMLVKGIIDHGWYLSNPSLGAPFGQHLNDYPQGADNLSLLVIRGLAILSSKPAIVVNAFYLLTFPLAAVSCHLVLRRLGIRAPAAGVSSVLFSLLAYHFFRGESHLLLSAYFSVPLSGYLFMELLGEGRLFARRAASPPRRLRWASRRSLITIALCLVIGSANLYYATFALVLIVSATLIGTMLRRWGIALQGAIAAGLIAVTVAINLAPTFAYRAEHGSNAVVERSAAADENTNEAFALRPANLVLPVPQSRIPPLRHIASSYDRAIAPAYCESCFASLGTVGTVGLGSLALVLIATLVGAGGWLAERRLLRHASAGAAIALIAGTVGGLGSLLEVFVTPDIRAWNRISVVIAFFSLLAAAVLLEAVVFRLRRRRRGGMLAAALAGVVLVLGVLDQTTEAFIPRYAVTARQWHSDAAFVAAIEARLPRGASVFQLPYVPFPEGYPQTQPGDRVATYATKYELLRGYLHSTTLRWSYGAMKGRSNDWSAQLAVQPLPLVVSAAAAAGFAGIWVDPAGFEPAKGARVLAGLRALLGVAPLVSRDHDLWFFDLRPYWASLRRTHPAAELAQLRESTLHPLQAGCSSAGLALENPRPGPVAATLAVHFLAGATRVHQIVLSPGGTVVPVPPQVRYATLTDAAQAPFAVGRSDSIVPGLTGPPCPR